jgi:hypothetical protein
MRERTAFVAEIDPNELAVRMMEAGHGAVRPEGVTAADLIDALEPAMRAPLLRMARAAAEYIAERIGKASTVDP